MSIPPRLSVKKRRIILFLALLVALTTAATVPFPQSISLPCTIEPVAIWYVMRDGTDFICTGWERNLLNPGGRNLLRQFERPDLVEIEFTGNLKDGSLVSAGDTIGIIRSYETSGQLRALEALKNKAIAEKRALMTGERTEDQDVARQAVTRAQAALEAFLPERNRIKSLYENGDVSLSEWQRAEAEAILLTSTVRLAEAELRASEAAVREVDIAIAEAEIAAIQQQIITAENYLSAFELLIAPVAGIVRMRNNDGHLINIERIDTVVAVIVLPESITASPIVSETVEIMLYSDPDNIRTGNLNLIDFRGTVLSDGTQLTDATAFVPLDNRDLKMSIGMNGISRIPLGNITFYQGIKMKLQGIRTSVIGG